MNHRRRLVALGTSSLSFLFLLAGCGDFSSGDSATGGASTGGAGVSTGGTATGGVATGGISTGGTATGGAPTGGSGAGAPSCTNVTPCGGDLVGTWTAMSSCLVVSGNLDMTSFGLGCTSAPATGSLQVTGSWTANADGTYTDGTTTTGNEQFELPASCLTVSGTVTTCDRVSAPLGAVGFASATCLDAASSGGCSCSTTVDQEGGVAFISTSAAPDGDYTVAGNVVTLTARRFEAQYSYCVSGSTLTMTLDSAPATGPVLGTIVFQKQ